MDQNQNTAVAQHDTKNALMIGLIIGIFLIPTESHLPFVNKEIVYVLGIFLFPVLAIVGIAISKLLFSRIPVLLQFAKFGLIGVSNTAINFGVLNVVAQFTGIYKGWLVFFFGAVAFTAALVNSYIWNSHWSFGESSQKTHEEFVRFFLVTFVGFLLNNYVLYFVSTHVSPIAGIRPDRWLIVANVVATLVVMFWNFSGFKFIVFRKKAEPVVA